MKNKNKKNNSQRDMVKDKSEEMSEQIMQDMPNARQIQKFLGNANYPITKGQLINLAKGHRAPEDVINALQRLPDKEYAGEDEIFEEIGKIED